MDLSICIVNWNRLDLLIPCLDSIYNNSEDLLFEVIVVDNASDDGTADVISERYPQVTLIANEKNFGFAKANNQALQLSSGAYCLLLNNDTVVVEDALKTMVTFMESHDDVGVLTCALYPSVDLMNVGISFSHTFPTPRILVLNDLVNLTGLIKLFPGTGWIQRLRWTGYHPEREQEVEHVSGACMLVRREAMVQSGMLDESFFMYMEETDWCFRIRRNGWRIFYTPTARIVHYGEQGSKMRTDREKLYFRSTCHFFKKHYGSKSVVTYKFLYYLLLNPLKIMRRLFRSRYQMPASIQ